MDNSDMYINMCERAKEIQRNYHPRVGDYIYFTGGSGYTFSFENDTSNSKWKKEALVWRDNYYRSGYVSATHGYTGSHLGYEDFHAVVVEGFYFPTKECVVLPRQDQLQELLGYALTPLISSFHNFITECLNYAQNLKSMEQLWLAFVMLEKYRKVWGGSDWEKV